MSYRDKPEGFLEWWSKQEYRSTYKPSVMGACEAAWNAGLIWSQDREQASVVAALREAVQIAHDNWNLEDYGVEGHPKFFEKYGTVETEEAICNLITSDAATALSRREAAVRWEEAEWWRAQIESRIHGINFYQKKDFKMDIEYKRIAELRAKSGEQKA